MFTNMPGSLLSSQDIHSDHSDTSYRSTDSRASGKKVSFNKAVRVKQYPWNPEESRDCQASPLLSGKRFWFKVYKKNSDSPPQQNVWNKTDRPVWVETNSDDLPDSLTPIAEDEDGSDADDQNHEFGPNITNQTLRTYDENGNCCNGHPLDPPIDYIQEEPLFSRVKRHSLRKAEPARPEIDRDRQEQGKNRFQFIEKKIQGSDLRNKAANGFSSLVRTSDFRRPTISSAAKSSVDKLAKQPIISVRLPRAVAKEPSFEKRKESISCSQRLRDRRSRSNDDNLNSSRFHERTQRLDKAVSTDNLSTGFEIDAINGFWTSQQKSRDKATQCSGTLTKYEKNNLNVVSEVFKTSKPTSASTFSQAETSSSYLPTKDTYKNGHASHNDNDLKQLSLHGKNCISGIRHNGAHKVLDLKTGRTDTKLRHYSSSNNRPKAERFEYDYVLDTSSAADLRNSELSQQDGGGYRSTISRDECDGKRKPSAWRAMVDNNMVPSTIGHVWGKQIPLSSSQRTMASPALRRIKISNDSEARKDIPSDSGSKIFESFCADRNSVFTEGQMLGAKDIESPIDWSMSGFRLSARSDNNLSSSSDSECVIHRRPPLLMYIPGVSHHHKPAVEDDRLSALSGISRSEAEDDLSPLSIGARNEFQRRYSMPRSGKLNFLKWKTSKKLLK